MALSVAQIYTESNDRMTAKSRFGKDVKGNGCNLIENTESFSQDSLQYEIWTQENSKCVQWETPRRMPRCRKRYFGLKTMNLELQFWIHRNLEALPRCDGPSYLCWLVWILNYSGTVHSCLANGDQRSAHPGVRTAGSWSRALTKC
jgi:hypothetical protein